MVTIIWDRTKRDEFAAAYKTAVDLELEQFTFDGHQFVTGYAKYLLQYLNQQMPPAPRRTYARSRGGR